MAFGSRHRVKKCKNASIEKLSTQKGCSVRKSTIEEGLIGFEMTPRT